MKKIFKILAVSALLLAGGSCKDDGPEEGMIWDFINPDVCFFVSDAQTGEDLLNPGAERNILGQPISVKYRGSDYKLLRDEERSATRASYVRPFGLRLEQSYWPEDATERYLSFGDFDPTRGYHGEMFVVDWGDGTSSEVKFDLYIEWRRGRPDVSSPIWLDGKSYPGAEEGGYAHWTFHILK